jgi:hypothetical protein
MSMASIITIMAVSIADYPVAVETGGVKRMIMIALIAASVIAVVAITTWKVAAQLVDNITNEKWSIMDKINTSDPETIRDKWRMGVIGTAGLVAVTIITGFLLPPIGANTIRFQDIVNTYEINNILLNDPAQEDKLTSDGKAIVVDNLQGGNYKVIWYPTTSSIPIRGLINMSNGRLRLVSDQGKSPALKKTHFDF